jgi:succinate-semialdehyde dehydrogenase/glutarate-semialdehyde dehydrogenase
MLESFAPATGELIGSVPVARPEEVGAIVDDAAGVQPFWAGLPLAERARYMRRAAQVVIDNLERLAQLIAREQGKPITEAHTMELLPTIDSLHWIAEQGPRILGDERIPHPQVFLKQKRSFFSHEPLGVVGVVSPWNYPWSIPFGEVAIALMCGNAAVLKPAPETPLIGQQVQWVLERAGVPDGLVRTIHGDADVGRALVASDVAKVFFTGSVEAGRSVGVECAKRMKGSVLELGGKDPAIVLRDAHLETAVAGCLWAGFANAGQTCSGIERIYVVRELADALVEGMIEGAGKLRIGDPLSAETEVGPMISPAQRAKVVELVDDAVAAGAELRCGGPVEVDGLGGPYFAPAILTGVTHEMRIMREEIFGPVIPVVTVDSEEEAIALANDSDFGLGASIWTLDRERGTRIARRLETGMVWINDHAYSHGACQCSWGGTKESGLGRSHSKFGFYECVNVKLVDWDPARLPRFWWHPYDAALARGVGAAGQLLYGRDEDKLGALRRGAAPVLQVGRRVVRGRRGRTGTRAATGR